MAYQTFQDWMSAFAVRMAALCPQKRVNKCQRRVRGAKTQFVR